MVSDVRNQVLANEARATENFVISNALGKYKGDGDYMVRNVGDLSIQVCNIKEDKIPHTSKLKAYSKQ